MVNPAMATGRRHAYDSGFDVFRWGLLKVNFTRNCNFQGHFDETLKRVLN